MSALIRIPPLPFSATNQRNPSPPFLVCVSATKEIHKGRSFHPSFHLQSIVQKARKREGLIPHCIRLQKKNKRVLLFLIFSLFESIYFTSIKYLDFSLYWLPCVDTAKVISITWITVVCNNPCCVQSRAIKKIGKPDYKGNDSESFLLYLFWLIWFV